MPDRYRLLVINEAKRAGIKNLAYFVLGAIKATLKTDCSKKQKLDQIEAIYQGWQEVCNDETIPWEVKEVVQPC